MVVFVFQFNSLCTGLGTLFEYVDPAAMPFVYPTELTAEEITKRDKSGPLPPGNVIGV